MKALFMVNSLSNGGAERVCINMANELIKQGYQVDFIVLGNDPKNQITYEINKKIRIYDLNLQQASRIKKLLKIITSVRKVNKIIKENEKEGSYDLITSHLPMTNVVTRLSNVKNRALYVFHTKIAKYNKVKSKMLFYIILKWIYGNKKLVAVSEGVRQEAIQDYKIKAENIKTIYNPIDVEEINKKKEEPITIEGKYFVQVGRFNEAKRQDRMIDVFYQGKFYENYQLVFCGVGELEEEVKKKVKDLHLEQNVLFLGWQNNVYKWIKNAELLVCTSDYEAFPMNLIEAMLCETKIVASNCEYGPSEILLEEYAQFLVEPNNIEEYISKIHKALKEYPTKENRIVQKCMASNIIQEYLEFMTKERK